uniref:Uncharacterized protein n=1 Tax=Marmota marmota marmota TaxID=9994 RepID=A0A8C5YKI4_MARMA
IPQSSGWSTAPLVATGILELLSRIQTPVVPASQGAEAGGSLDPRRSSGLFWTTQRDLISEKKEEEWGPGIHTFGISSQTPWARIHWSRVTGSGK